MHTNSQNLKRNSEILGFALRQKRGQTFIPRGLAGYSYSLSEFEIFEIDDVGYGSIVIQWEPFSTSRAGSSIRSMELLQGIGFSSQGVSLYSHQSYQIPFNLVRTMTTVLGFNTQVRSVWPQALSNGTQFFGRYSSLALLTKLENAIKGWSLPKTWVNRSSSIASPHEEIIFTHGSYDLVSP